MLFVQAVPAGVVLGLFLALLGVGLALAAASLASLASSEFLTALLSAAFNVLSGAQQDQLPRRRGAARP